MNSKKIYVIIFSVLLLIIIGVLYNRFFNVKVSIDNSKIYSEQELKDAINTALIKFKEFPAVLKKIYYDEEKSQRVSADYANMYNSEKAIVLYSSFKTLGQSAINQGLNDYFYYDNFMWILVKDNEEKWILKDWGY